jgi:hypothetical protein
VSTETGQLHTLYSEKWIRMLLGVRDIKRSDISSPGSTAANIPPGTYEIWQGTGRWEMQSDGDQSPKVLEYSINLQRALKGMLPNRVLAQLIVFIKHYRKEDLSLTYQDIKPIFGPPIVKQYSPYWPEATDGGRPPDSVLIFECATAIDRKPSMPITFQMAPFPSWRF